MRPVLFGIAACTLVACSPETGGELAVLGPYREPNDQCRRVSPTPVTASLIEAGADLVACPQGYADIPVFITDVGAEEVGALNDWRLFRVPQPWRG